MRCWKTSDGRILAESKAGEFLLFSADGAFKGIFATGMGSDQEHLYSTTYTVEAGELRCVFEDENTDTCRTHSERTTELTGLTPAVVEGIEARVRKIRP
ncbi:MAG TPA: hypothetical protein VF950_03055 [Planctomycetota bacterium]